MDIKGKFTFTVSDKCVDFESIGEYLPVRPIKIVKKGQLIGKSKKIETPLDIFSIERPILDDECILNQLILLVNDLMPYCEFIKGLTKKYENVAINCYLRSEFGQIGFEMSNEVVVKIASLGLAVNFHILSFGKVE